jgi:hypothetical protein
MASTANLAASVNLAANSVQVNWTDTFPAGAVYSIQSVTAGSGTTISTQAASGTGVKLG